ncbi:hypothetical protein KC19_VG028700 [Ceratodon purpureus]|uniref:Uncharacterized protein n=1 Tax=Ceratodon purpureus TaxID=3225 RepID=A0A8T0HLS4_CERPU|nr:hypothetical protein KC19_VG028700 [Ceratodon purpureus]
MLVVSFLPSAVAAFFVLSYPAKSSYHALPCLSNLCAVTVFCRSSCGRWHAIQTRGRDSPLTPHGLRLLCAHSQILIELEPSASCGGTPWTPVQSMPQFAWLGGITRSSWEWLGSRKTTTKRSGSIIPGTTSATPGRWRFLSQTPGSASCPYTSYPSLRWLTCVSVLQPQRIPLLRSGTERRFTHASITGSH